MLNNQLVTTIYTTKNKSISNIDCFDILLNIEIIYLNKSITINVIGFLFIEIYDIIFLDKNNNIGHDY